MKCTDRTASINAIACGPINSIQFNSIHDIFSCPLLTNFLILFRSQGHPYCRNFSRLDLYFDSRCLCEFAAGRYDDGTLRPRRPQEAQYRRRGNGDKPQAQGTCGRLRLLRICGTGIPLSALLSVDSSLSPQYYSLSISHCRVGATVWGHENVDYRINLK